MLVNDEVTEKLAKLPSLGKSHLGELKIELAGVRVWVSESNKSDVVVERVVGGYWEYVPKSAIETVLQISINILGI